MLSQLFTTLCATALLLPVIFGDSVDNEIGTDYRVEKRPVIRCVSSSDCGSNECSVMGMQRFSEPRCEALGGLGAPCRMYEQEPENKTLSFPHATMECEDVYMQFCPCAQGLVCREAVCSRPKRRPSANRNPWVFGRLH